MIKLQEILSEIQVSKSISITTKGLELIEDMEKLGIINKKYQSVISSSFEDSEEWSQSWILGIMGFGKKSRTLNINQIEQNLKKVDIDPEFIEDMIDGIKGLKEKEYLQ